MSSPAQSHHVAGSAEATRRQEEHSWQGALGNSDRPGNWEPLHLAVNVVPSHSMAADLAAVLVLGQPGPAWYQDLRLSMIVALVIVAERFFVRQAHAFLTVSQGKSIADYSPYWRCPNVTVYAC
jgi:hypothetical protein